MLQAIQSKLLRKALETSPFLTIGLWAAYRLYRYSRAKSQRSAELAKEQAIVPDAEGAEGYIRTPAL